MRKDDPRYCTPFYYGFDYVTGFKADPFVCGEWTVINFPQLKGAENVRITLSTYPTKGSKKVWVQYPESGFPFLVYAMKNGERDNVYWEAEKAIMKLDISLGNSWSGFYVLMEERYR